MTLVDFDTFDTVNRLIEFEEFTGVRGEGWRSGREGEFTLLENVDFQA